MKKLLLIAALAAATYSATAQGTIDFRNNTSAPVFDADGTTRLSGATFVANLYWATSAAGPWTVVNAAAGGAAAAVPFRTGTGAGVWNAGTDPARVTGVAATGTVFLQVRAWDTATGATFDTATKRGSSTPWSQAQGGAGDPPALPTAITGNGFTSFSLVIPEPSTVLLSLLGAALLVVRRRK